MCIAAAYRQRHQFSSAAWCAPQFQPVRVCVVQSGGCPIVPHLCSHLVLPFVPVSAASDGLLEIWYDHLAVAWFPAWVTYEDELAVSVHQHKYFFAVHCSPVSPALTRAVPKRAGCCCCCFCLGTALQSQGQSQANRRRLEFHPHSSRSPGGP